MTYDFSKARLIIFDFDGIMIKKIPEEFPASLIKEFLPPRFQSAEQQPKTPNNGNFGYNNFLIDIVTLRFKGTNWIRELEKMGVNTNDKNILTAISRKRYEHDKSKLSLYGWVPRVIPELAKTKKLAILTNNSKLTVMGCLHGLERYFNSIKTWENAPKLKPEPDGILCICSELNIALTETLMIGDSQDDQIAAEKAGINSLIVRNGKHFSRLI